MREFRQERHIDAPVDHVWAVLADVQDWPAWTRSIERIEILSASALAVGSRVLIRQPRLRPAVWEVTVWEPPRRLEWRSRSIGVSVTADHLLESHETGCLSKHSVKVDGLLSGLILCFAGRLIDQYVQLEADGLKRRAEQA